MNYLYSIDVTVEEITQHYDFWTGINFIVFKPQFNNLVENIELELLDKKKIIFSNFSYINQILLLLKNDNNEHSCYNNCRDHSTFNQPLYLSELIFTTHLILGENFNNIIQLPRQLIYLELNDNFNHQINLPDSLEFFSMGTYFNCPIILPSNLMVFRMNNIFNHPINLPKNLKYMTIGNEYTHQLLFPNLLHLKIRSECLSHYENLPNSLESLSIAFQKNLTNECIMNLPNEIKNLSICANLPEDLTHLPDSIEVISIGHFDKKIINLPKNLKKISFCKSYRYSSQLKKKLKNFTLTELEHSFIMTIAN